MLRSFFITLFGVLIGIFIAFLVIDYPPVHTFFYPVKKAARTSQVIGFLPYWLVGKANDDYDPYITSLSYFGLTIGQDGKIIKVNDDNEAEPGWHALYSGLLDEKFRKAKEQNVSLSLLVFSGDNDAIDAMIADPKESATNTLRDVLPVMRTYGFTDLNVDVESTQEASDGARLQFTAYIKELHDRMQQAHAGTITMDISPDNILRHGLIDLKAVEPFVDYVVIMGYDFHYPGSAVTGAVGPMYGAGDVSEFDTQAAVELARKTTPAKKIILGIPLYGYEWETVDAAPRSAVIPGTGLTASTKRIDTLLSNCSTCSASFDERMQEAYVIYYDPQTGSYHQLFYPDKRSTRAKIDFAKKAGIGGLALWALGYEDNTILDPLKQYSD